MTTRFTLEMLPANEGDCIWISYAAQAGPTRHLLIDGGRKSTGKQVGTRLKTLPAGERLDLVVVTHVDRDHIEGLLEIAEAGFHGVEVEDVWFNGHDHLLNGYVAQGAMQGERLGDALANTGLPWNKAFGGRRIAIEPGRPLRLPPLADGLELTLLSPTPATLAALLPVWDAEVAKAGMKDKGKGQPDGPKGFERLGPLDVDGLAAEAYQADGTRPNGSSIALIAQFAGRTVLLGADAHADVLEESLRALGDGSRVAVDAFKVPHHGSSRNLSKAVLDLVLCGKYLISTNGSYFNHPDRSAIARIVKFGGPQPEIVFNYRSGETAAWDDDGLRKRYGYTTRYPSRNGWMAIDLLAG